MVLGGRFEGKKKGETESSEGSEPPNYLTDWAFHPVGESEAQRGKEMCLELQAELGPRHVSGHEVQSFSINLSEVCS